MEKSDFTDTNQGRFHYYEYGDSKKVAHFCHGNSLNAATYHPFLKEIAKHDIKIIASDLRGHGLSTKENTKQIRNWNIFSSDLQCFIHAKMKAPVIGIGHSIGAYYTYAAASIFPGLFSSLILIDPIIFPSSTVWLINIMRMAGLSKFMSLPKMTRKKKRVFKSRQEAFLHYYKKGMFRTWTKEFVKAYADTALYKNSSGEYELCCHPELEAKLYEAVPLNTWSHVKNINIPILVLRGENSDLFYKNAALKLEKKLNSCQYYEFKELGHFLMMEDKKRVADKIVGFIK